MLTVIHFWYAFFVILIILAMLFRKNVVSLCLIGTFVIGFCFFDYSFFHGIQTIFWSFWAAGSELLDLILLIAMMSTLIMSLQKAGVDQVLILPFRFLLISPACSYWVLGLAMYLASVIFWPTPATALVGAILVPPAIKSGLSPMGAAISINIAGHGMALSGDPIIQGAPGFTERAIGLSSGTVVTEAVIISIFTGILSMLFSFVLYRREFFNWTYSKNILNSNIEEPDKLTSNEKTGFIKLKQILVTILVLLGLISVLYYLINTDITGGETTALLGGFALTMALIVTLFISGYNFWEYTAVYLQQGFVFAVKIFGKIIPITGFFFLGSHHSSLILSDNAPILLFDLAEKVSEIIPLSPLMLHIGNLGLGVISGLDGSGFSGIAITANFARSMYELTEVSLNSLAIIGQIGAIWTGGGTLVSWAFGLVVTAGVTGVDPIELARKNLLPVTSALVITAIIVAFIYN